MGAGLVAASAWFGWYAPGSFSVGARDLPFAVLFDAGARQSDLTLAVALVGVGSIAFVGCLVQQAGWLRRALGLMVMVMVATFAWRIDAFAGDTGSSETLFELLGVGPVVAAAGGLLLAISPPGLPTGVRVVTP